MLRSILNKSLVLIFIFTFSFFIYAEDIILSIPIIPGVSDTKDDKPFGGFIDLYKDMAKHYKDGKIILLPLSPFDRSIANVLNGNADFHYPITRSSSLDESNIPYDFVPEPLGQVAFVLYTKADAPPLDMKNLAKYKIEVFKAHSQYFKIKFPESISEISSFQRILSGRIDGFIHAQEPADASLKINNVKNIRRQFYQSFDSVAIIAKTDRGAKVKLIVNDIIKKMKADKSLYNYVGKSLYLPYNDWQPEK
jgi:polar amino acid transport system substrate-binding protein